MCAGIRLRIVHGDDNFVQKQTSSACWSRAQNEQPAPAPIAPALGQGGTSSSLAIVTVLKEGLWGLQHDPLSLPESGKRCSLRLPMPSSGRSPASSVCVDWELDVARCRFDTFRRPIGGGGGGSEPPFPLPVHIKCTFDLFSTRNRNYTKYICSKSNTWFNTIPLAEPFFVPLQWQPTDDRLRHSIITWSLQCLWALMPQSETNSHTIIVEFAGQRSLKNAFKYEFTDGSLNYIYKLI